MLHACRMVLMAALVNLPIGVLATLSVVMIAGHNLFDGFSPAPDTFFATIWPFLLGISMWLQFKMNPQPMDDASRAIA